MLGVLLGILGSDLGFAFVEKEESLNVCGERAFVLECYHLYNLLFSLGVFICYLCALDL